MRKLFSLTFVMILLLPWALWIGGTDSPQATTNGNGFSPGLQLHGLLEPDFYRAWDHHFNEHFALRSLLLRAKNWTDYHLFRSTDAPGVYVGRRGWLFDRASFQDLGKDACWKEGWIAQRHRDLLAIDRLFSAAGRRFVFAVAPGKARLYPEFVGPVPQKGHGGKSLYASWLDRQRTLPLSGFVRLDDDLLEAKHRGIPIYDATGAFWNPEGAGVAARAILDFLFNDDPNATQPPDDLTRQMGLGPDIQHSKPLSGKSNFPQRGLSLLLYGGPHIAPLLPHLASRFERVDAITSDCLPSYDFSEAFKTYDVVLLLPSESDLEHLCLETDRILNELDVDALAVTHCPIPLTAVTALDRISLASHAEGLQVKSMGPDSTMALADLTGSDANTLRLLKVTLVAPGHDRLHVCIDKDAGHKLTKTIKAGTNHLYIPLPRGEKIFLQINPGQAIGLFRLTAMELLGLPLLGNPQDAPVMARGLIPSRPVPPEAQKTSPQEKVHLVSQPDAGVSTDAETTIRVNDFADGRVFQRRGNSADILVSGTYTGTPKAIEAAVFRNGMEEPFIPWTPIDMEPVNGIFMGILAEVPQGAWYRIAVRFSDRPRVQHHGSADWGVGMLVACIGQSNMKEWFYTGDDLEAHSLLRLYRHRQWRPMGSEGNGAIAFGNGLIRKLGIPVGLLDYAVNGSGLCKKADWGTGYWTDRHRRSIYSRFVEGVAAAGGCLEYVVWMQGEADAARATVAEQEYYQTLVRFIQQQVRSDIANGSSRPYLPFLIVGIPGRPGGDTASYRAVRSAQEKVAETTDECYMAARTLDMPFMGRRHLTAEAYRTLGLRVAGQVLSLLGKETR